MSEGILVEFIALAPWVVESRDLGRLIVSNVR